MQKILINIITSNVYSKQIICCHMDSIFKKLQCVTEWMRSAENCFATVVKFVNLIAVYSSFGWT